MRASQENRCDDREPRETGNGNGQKDCPAGREFAGDRRGAYPIARIPAANVGAHNAAVLLHLKRSTPNRRIRPDVRQSLSCELRSPP